MHTRNTNSIYTPPSTAPVQRPNIKRNVQFRYIRKLNNNFDYFLPAFVLLPLFYSFSLSLSVAVLHFCVHYGNIQMSTHSDSYEQRKAIATNAALRKLTAIGCHSMPNSPRLMPKHAHFLRSSASPARNSAAQSHTKPNTNDANQSIGNGTTQWHLSALTDHLNVQQVNNYSNQNGIPEINWQERCLELQLELHRSKNQGERIRGMLRDKVSVNLPMNMKCVFVFVFFFCFCPHPIQFKIESISIYSMEWCVVCVVFM